MPSKILIFFLLIELFVGTTSNLVRTYFSFAIQLKSNSIKRKKVCKYLSTSKQKIIIFSKKNRKKESLNHQGRREGMSRLLRYYFDSIKQLKKASKKYCKTRRAWPWHACTPTYLCFVFFGFSGTAVSWGVLVLLLVRGSADKVFSEVSPGFADSWAI